MKRLICSALVMVALSGCVTNQPNPYNQKFDAQFSSLRAALDSGKINRTTYFERLYDVTLENPKATGMSRYRLWVTEMIPLARKLDAGEISKTQFDDEGKRLHAAMLSEVQREAAESERIRAHNNAIQLQQTQQTLQMLNANRPPPMQFAPQINCRSRQSFGTVYTDCN